ncbi:MAG: hypothetical protein LUG99_09265 [Lachnospiraceae bacterium]|nr:hypothetical protein [Lachnospiraceae bacterium]
MKNTNIEKRTGVDLEELSRLSRLCVGSRTLVDYSKLTGLSTSFISKIVNASDNLARPTKRSLRRFTGANNEYAENGITAEQLFTAAGYEPDETDNPEPCFPRAAQNSGLRAADAVASVYSSKSPVFPLEVVLKALVGKGMVPDFTISFKPSSFTIKGNSEEELTVIPALCADNEKRAIVESTAMANLVTSFRNDRILYFFLTDNQLLYEDLCSLLKPSEEKIISVLYTADDKEITDQKFIVSDEQMRWIRDNGQIKEMPLSLV